MSFPFCQCFSLYGQETLHLSIEDSQKQPLPSAVVHFMGKHYVSDNNGRVSIPKLSKGKYPIKVNYLGFLDYEATISIPAANPYIITLQEEVKPTLRDNSFRKSIPATEGECNP